MPFIIHRKPPYHIYVEEGVSGAMAHVAQLPGCFATGSTASQALGATPRAITDFLLWLRGHHEPLVPEAHISRPSMADLFVAEVRQEGAATIAGSTAALFEFDKEAWNDEKLERTLRWLNYSRADLLAAVGDLTQAELKARPLTAGRTWYSTLRHIADAEYGYINGVAGPLGEEEAITGAHPADIRACLRAVRELMERHARAVPSDMRASVILPVWAARPEEAWTLARALRRALEHERQHTREL